MAIMDHVAGCIAAFSLTLLAASATNMCTDLNGISHIVKNSYLAGYSFETLSGSSLMRCAKECMLRNLCLSFNFDVTSSACSLNSKNSSDVSATASSTMVYSNIDLWPGRMIKECEGHNCEINERCDVSSAGVRTCVITGCLEPPAITNGIIDTGGKIVWNVGALQVYTCPGIQYTLQGKLLCQADGTWSVAICKRLLLDD